MDKQLKTEKNFRYLGLITSLFVTVLIVSNIASNKITVIGPFTFDGGTILFPLSYIFGDILTEVYGYARSRRVIWTGFFMLVIASLVFNFVSVLPAAPGWTGQAAYDHVLVTTLRIVTASLVAYFCGEFLNSYVLAKMKVNMAGKHLWLRTIGSTVIGEAVDSVIFVLVAFWGVLDYGLLSVIIISNYVFKCAIEILLTPVTYKMILFLKKKEKEDYYDENTDFNPFLVR